MARLTIGIPVLNEIKFIDGLIVHLEEINRDFAPAIEFIFVDNFSTDGSREFLKDVESRGVLKNAQFFYNSENQGFNYSCDVLIDSSRTDHLWIIGAQDRFYLDGIQIVVDLIISKNPTLIICNARMRDEISDKIINESLWGQLEKSEFISLESFFSVMGGPCQAVSCNIFRTEILHKNPKDSVSSRYWGYFERICDLLIASKDSAQINYISTPLIEILIEEDVVSASGISLFGKVPRKDYGPFYTSLELAEISNSKFSNSKKIWKSFTVFRDPIAIPRCFVIAKSRGLRIDSVLFWRIVKAYKKSATFWILGLPILLTPRFICRLLVKTKPIVHFLRNVLRIKEF